MNKQPPPVFLNLLQIRLPLPGVVSILHRVSGLLMVLSLPLLVAFLERSLMSEQGFVAVQSLLTSLPAKLLLLGLSWGLIHHSLAGIRFILLDVDVGVEKTAARGSAWVVLIVSVLLTIVLAGVWW